MYPAIASNLKKGKGGLYLAEWVNGVAPDENDLGVEVGNCESITYSPTDVQTDEKYSSTQSNNPLLLREVTRASWRLSAQCDEHTVDNLLMFFGASESELSQSADSQVDTILESVVPGRSYSIGRYKTGSVQLAVGSTILTADSDYTLYPDRGVVKILTTGLVSEGDNIDVSYEASAVAAYKRLAVGQTLNRNVKITYFADDQNTGGVGARDIIVIPKAAVILEGEYQLVSDEYGNFTINFDALDDSSNYPGRGLGWLLRGAAD
jgi:hypothetical protein